MGMSSGVLNSRPEVCSFYEIKVSSFFLRITLEFFPGHKSEQVIVLYYRVTMDCCCIYFN